MYTLPVAWDPRFIGHLATSDATGAFAYADLKVFGEYALRAVLTEGGEWFGTTTARSGDVDVRLQLRPGVEPETVLVRVFAADGMPVAAARALYRTSHSHTGGVVERGRVFFERARINELEDPTGAFVVVLAPKGADGTPLSSGDARLDGVRGGGIYELRLPAEAWIAGRVVGPNGRGVAGTRLRAVRVDEGYYRSEPPMRYAPPWAPKDDEVVTSSADGSFRIGRIGEGEEWVLADPPAEFLPAQPLLTRSGATDVLVVLREGTSAIVRVLDPDGLPVRGAYVRTSKEADRPDRSWPGTHWGGEVETGEEGTAIVPHLERDRALVLTVLAPTDSDDLLEHVEQRWLPTDTTVRLERGLPLSGVVQDSSGAAVGYVDVKCREPDGRTSSSPTDKNGRFRFKAMPAVTVELTVAGESLAPQRPVRLNAGRRDVVLTVVKAAPTREK